MNICILNGSLVAKPEIKTTRNNRSMASFAIAVRREFAREGQQNVDFIKCVAWGKTADYLMNYGDKGSRIMVRGALEITKYQKGDQTQYLSQINVEKVELAPRKQESQTPLEQPNGETFTEVDESELPF